MIKPSRFLCDTDTKVKSLEKYAEMSVMAKDPFSPCTVTIQRLISPGTSQITRCIIIALLLQTEYLTMTLKLYMGLI